MLADELDAFVEIESLEPTVRRRSIFDVVQFGSRREDWEPWKRTGRIPSKRMIVEFFYKKRRNVSRLQLWLALSCVCVTKELTELVDNSKSKNTLLRFTYIPLAILERVSS